MNTELNIAAAARPVPALPAAAAIKATTPSTAQNKATAAAVAPLPHKADPTEMMRELQEAVQKINEEMKKNGRELDFSMDKVLDYPVVTVKNSVTGEVIRQIPNETTIRIAHNLAELKGLLHNKSA